MAVKIQIRNDLSTVWSEVNPVLMEGELGLETDTKKIKIGDGETVWTSLDYATQGERGRGLEYEWRGTELGVRAEGEAEFQYVELRDRIDAKKIANLERELRTHKQTVANVNVNQEARQTAEGRRVVSLPKTAGEGHGEFGLKGLTATNLVENGDFREGLTGWRGHTSYIKDNKFAGSDSGFYKIYQPVHINENHIYYGFVKIDNEDLGHYSYNLSTHGNYGSRPSIVGHSDAKKGAGVVSGVVTATETKVSNIGINAQVSGQAQKIDTKEVFLINLTQTFGAGNEPTKEECDKIFANYFEGTQSVNGSVRVKSEGKNLINYNDVHQGSVNVATGSITMYALSSYPRRYVDFIEVEPDTEYAVTGNRTLGGDINAGLAYYDKDKKYISGDNKRSTVITTPPNAKYIRITVGDNAQLELGSTPTSYEPYIDSTLYLNVPKLRSLPSGVTDEIRKDGSGGYEVVQRTGKIVLDGTEDWRVSTLAGKSKYIRLDSLFRGNYIGKIVSQNYTTVGRYQDVNTRDFTISGYATTAGGNNWLYIQGEIGESLGEFTDRLANNNETVYYQLAEPIIIPLNTSGELITRPSGTVYVEDVVADVATYADKITVEQPIKELDQLSVVDYETGAEQELDTAQAVIAEDKLSFTHPELSNGDIVFFDYYLDVESTDGLASVEHYDSRYTIKDSVTGDFYKWNIGIADGEPSIKLEEL